MPHDNDRCTSSTNGHRSSTISCTYLGKNMMNLDTMSIVSAITSALKLKNTIKHNSAECDVGSISPIEWKFTQLIKVFRVA